MRWLVTHQNLTNTCHVQASAMTTVYFVQKKHFKINQIRFLVLLHRLTEHLCFLLEIYHSQEHLSVFKVRVSHVLANYLSYNHHIASDMFCSGLHACKTTWLLLSPLSLESIMRQLILGSRRLSPEALRVASLSIQSKSMGSRKK